MHQTLHISGLYDDYTAFTVIPLFIWDRCSLSLENVYEGNTTRTVPTFDKTDTTIS